MFSKADIYISWELLNIPCFFLSKTKEMFIDY